MTTSIQPAIDSILTQLEPIDGEVQQLEQRLAELKRTKEKLEGAYHTLTGHKRSGRKAVGRNTKPCARKSDVLATCQEVLQRKGSLPKAELEAAVKENLSKQQGFSLSGIGLRLAECLKSGRFEIDANQGVSLRAPSGRNGSDKGKVTAADHD